MVVIEEITQGLLETTPDAIVIVDPDGRIVFVNARAEALFGHARETLIGQAVEVLLPQRFRDHHRAYCQGYFNSPRYRPMGTALELYGLRKDGSEFPVEISLSWHESAHGRLALSAIRDISERRQAEAAIRVSEQRLILLMDALPVCISYVDAEQRYRIVNRTYEDWFGHPRSELQGKHLWEVLGDAAYAAIKPYVEAALAGETATFEGTIPYKDGGARRVEAIYVPNLAERGKVAGFFALVSDVTGLDQGEGRIHRHQAELAHRERLNTAGEMAAELAHEVNQPLTAVNSYAQTCLHMLRSGTVTPEELTATLEKVINQSRRAGEIIRRLRNFVRKTAPQRSAIDINALVREAASLAEVEAGDSGTRLRLDLGAALPVVTIDPVEIQQVILNLMRNGMEAMHQTVPEERVLTLRTTPAEGGDGIEIAVQDRGPGLSGEVSARLFQPFFTTKSDGTGLGLTISRSIVEAHGGRLWATANPDRGATFRFTLPAGELASGAGHDDSRP